MIDYDSKFENVIENLENQEWIKDVDDDDKYLYLYLEEANSAEMEPDDQEEMEEYIKEKLEQSELFNSKRGNI